MMTMWWYARLCIHKNLCFGEFRASALHDKVVRLPFTSSFGMVLTTAQTFHGRGEVPAQC